MALVVISIPQVPVAGKAVHLVVALSQYDVAEQSAEAAQVSPLLTIQFVPSQVDVVAHVLVSSSFLIPQVPVVGKAVHLVVVLSQYDVAAHSEEAVQVSPLFTMQVVPIQVEVAAHTLVASSFFTPQVPTVGKAVHLVVVWSQYDVAEHSVETAQVWPSFTMQFVPSQVDVAAHVLVLSSFLTPQVPVVGKAVHWPVVLSQYVVAGHSVEREQD
jgi:hypothetical protein